METWSSTKLELRLEFGEDLLEHSRASSMLENGLSGHSWRTFFWSVELCLRPPSAVPEDLGSGAAATQGVGDGIPGEELADPLAESPGVPGGSPQARLPAASPEVAADGASIGGVEGDGEPAGGLEEDPAQAPERRDNRPSHSRTPPRRVDKVTVLGSCRSAVSSMGCRPFEAVGG